MASLTIDFEHISSSKFITEPATSFAEIRDGEVAAVPLGMIISVGVIPVEQAGVAGTLNKHRAFATASADIGGYRLLGGGTTGFLEALTVTFSGFPIPTGEELFDEYATALTIMDGVESNNSTTEVGIRGRKNVGAGAEVCKIRIDVYHRTAAGVETLLDSFTTPDLTSSFADYTGNIAVNQAWGTDERLVAKFTGINLGDPE